MPDLRLRLVNLPSYGPDFNVDEAIWGWVRQEVIANLCLGTRAAVQEKVVDYLSLWPTDARKSNADAGPCCKPRQAN